MGSRKLIKYEISEKAEKSSILIFDMQGTLLKSYNNLTAGIGEICIAGKEFTPGIYLYSLIVNGTEIDTKRMILTN